MTSLDTTDARLLVLGKGDNIGVLTGTVKAGEEIVVSGQKVRMTETLGMGHKLAISAIPAGADILKYGFPIGFAETGISVGAHVHVHNVTSRYTTVEIME